MSQKTGDECTFRQRDLKEAIKAARNAGLENSIRRRAS
jgi:ribosomal protein S18